MDYSKLIELNKLIVKVLIFSFFVCLFSACGGSPAKQAAKKLCACAKETGMDKMEARLQAGQLEKENEAYQKVRLLQIECMGGLDDPRQKLNLNKEEIQKFEQELLLELQAQCPSIARNMGYEPITTNQN